MAKIIRLPVNTIDDAVDNDKNNVVDIEEFRIMKERERINDAYLAFARSLPPLRTGTIRKVEYDQTQTRTSANSAPDIYHFS